MKLTATILARKAIEDKELLLLQENVAASPTLYFGIDFSLGVADTVDKNLVSSISDGYTIKRKVFITSARI